MLALLVSAGVLVACGRSEDQSWEQVQQTGTLRVGMDATYPPFEYVDENNQIVGFDVDFALEIGRRLGLELTFVNIPYDSLYDSLSTRRVEVLISALVASPELEGKADFTVPYFNAGEHLVVPFGSDIRAMDDLDGLSLAVEYGSGGDVEARRWQRRLAALDVVRYPDPDSALLAVVNGETDAALVDGIAARLGVGQHADLSIATHVDDVLFAVAVGEDSAILLTRLNGVIDEMMRDGTVGALIEKWFGPQR